MKESIFKWLAPPNTEKVPILSKERNIPKQTLYRWRTKFLKNNQISNKKASKWSSSDKFQAVLETASISELETAKYCREKGIHVEELKNWIKQCQNANDHRLLKACEELKISIRTYQRLTKDGAVKEDQPTSDW